MNTNSKSFTFIWKIKNFSYNFNSSLNFGSQVFFIYGKCQSNWSLELYSKSTISEDCIACSLKRQLCPKFPGNIELDYEISFLTYDGTIINSELFLNKTFERGSINLTFALTAKINDVFLVKRNLYQPDDTLTVQCKMWIIQESLIESVRCSGETIFPINCKSFFGSIKKFSSLKKRSESNVPIEKWTKQCILSSVIIIVDDDKLMIEIIPVKYNPEFTYGLKIFIIAVFGDKIKIYDRVNCDRLPFYVPVPFSKARLTENNEKWLQNDTLLLEFEVCFPEDHIQIIHFPINDFVVYEYDFQDIKGGVPNTKRAVSTYKEHDNLTTLKDDFISLFEEGILSDIQLKSDTESFPAHTAILSARSPVFKSMFASDMREKTKRCVDIEDLNADVVRKMLIFIYSDILDDLDFESAKELYYAADKYSIVSLTCRCSAYLKENMLHSNCCDTLVLADKHQDEDLKNHAQNYIAKNHEAVFLSNEWKELVENHPRLTTDTFRAVYMKNRRT